MDFHTLNSVFSPGLLSRMVNPLTRELEDVLEKCTLSRALESSDFLEHVDF